MKKMLSLFLALVFVVGICATAPIAITANATTDSFTFELNEDGESYCLTLCNSNVSGTVEIPNEYNGKKVTSIGNFAFDNCESIETIILPASISNLGYQSFYNCYGLKKILVAADSMYFKSVSGVLFSADGKKIEQYPTGKTDSEYTIPNSVEIIADFAFSSNESLKSVYIPDSVKVIGSGAFSSCSKLENFQIPKTTTQVGDGAFLCTKYFYDTSKWVNNGLYADNCLLDVDHNATGELVIEKNTRLIAQSAVMGNQIESVVIPQSVTIICDFAFSNCTLLKSIDIPDSVTEIGKYCFENCRVLESASLPSNLTTLSKGLFIGCEVLKSIKLPENLKTIGDDVFNACFKLENVKIPESVEKIGKYAFCYCYNFTSVVIPDSVKVLDDRAFHSCENIKTVKLGKSLEYIGNGAFFSNGSLEEVIIPDSVQTIGQSAFAYNRSLNSAKLGSGIKNMGIGIFYYCTNLTNVQLSDGLTILSQEAFHGCPKLKSVVIPESIKTIGEKAIGYGESSQKINDFIINGKLGSVAEKYANENGFKFVSVASVPTLSTPTVTIKNTAKGIQVNWNAIENAQSYIVYRRVYNASTKKWSGWSKIKTGYTGTSYVDGTVTLGTQYRYTVRAVNGDVMSKYESTATLKYNVKPTVKISNVAKGVKVSWSTAANATGYIVYRSQYSNGKWSGWKNMGTAKANKTAWTDKNVKSGEQYKYTVRACYNKIKSSYKDSNVTVFLTQPTVKFSNASTGIKVSWSKVSGATGYTVYRSQLVDGKWSNWKSMGTAKSTKSSWTDKKVESGATYKYTVRAVSGKYKSSYTDTKGLLYLAQPTVTVKAVSNGINVAWSQCDGATGYTVYRSEYNTKTKKWSKWKSMGTAKATKSNWTDKKATKGVKYKYTVRAVNADTGSKSTYVASKEIKI
ncbi:MAG: leucine-rich repeat protein [Clostridia bacterium]|nr:leucine-rich repeat protein [Clostridia bacterium]